MIQAEFFSQAGRPVGFRLKGHSGFSSAGTDIVCAAVSSAAYLAANTITDVAGSAADVTAKDGMMFLKLFSPADPVAGAILKGFRLHMEGLQEQYPQNIEITDTEV